MIDLIENILLPLIGCWIIIVLLFLLSLVTYDIARDIFKK